MHKEKGKSASSASDAGGFLKQYTQTYTIHDDSSQEDTFRSIGSLVADIVADMETKYATAGRSR